MVDLEQVLLRVFVCFFHKQHLIKSYIFHLFSMTYNIVLGHWKKKVIKNYRLPSSLQDLTRLHLLYFTAFRISPFVSSKWVFILTVVQLGFLFFLGWSNQQLWLFQGKKIKLICTGRYRKHDFFHEPVKNSQFLLLFSDCAQQLEILRLGCHWCP